MLKNYLLRQRTKFEATLAFSMLEPWEKILCSKYILSLLPNQTPAITHLFTCIIIRRKSHRELAVIIFTFFTLLVASGLYQYLPQHLFIMQQRATYYLWGQDGDDRLLRHLVDSSTLKEL
ncbi:hypothetical protein BS17DRAFT_145176 [Gyrodon lividus]|nr:hypothetical protein BS17DRAFT_145176 [Gyrodon lividus]